MILFSNKARLSSHIVLFAFQTTTYSFQVPRWTLCLLLSLFSKISSCSFDMIVQPSRQNKCWHRKFLQITWMKPFPCCYLMRLLGSVFFFILWQCCTYEKKEKIMFWLKIPIFGHRRHSWKCLHTKKYLVVSHKQMLKCSYWHGFILSPSPQRPDMNIRW